MKEENKCEHPLGGWFGECALFNKDGTLRGTGVGKVVADVTWYNLSDPKQNPHTWAVCQYCLDCECIEGLDAENDRESIEAFYGKDYPAYIHQITEINYRDGRETEYPTRAVVIVDN